MKTFLMIIALSLTASLGFAQTSTTSTSAATAAIAASTSTPTKDAPQAPPGFEPIAGKAKDAQSVDANVLVMASYGSIFTLLTVYLLFMFRDRKRVSKELETLQKQIDAEASK